MLVAGLLWWVMPGVGPSGSASAGPGGGAPAGSQPTTPTTPTTKQPSTTHTPGQQPAVTPHPTPQHGGGTATGSGGGAQQGQSGTGQPTKSPQTAPHRVLPPPTGPCDPTKLTLAVVAPGAPAGDGMTIRLRMSTNDGTVCTLGITPSLLETRITSGGVPVWQSRSCPDALAAKNVVVRPTPAVVYSYAWDGQLNPTSCSATNQVADPGWYWAEAALIGGEPAETHFEITAAR